ncbi:hypothetical protein MGL_2750 [Malassezia globosa CBS 7966]|uniref:mRNA stability protein n=1 Tax=Malassezia globosa (strain ATCC MYA-4612 / CBS 7966) TaxID=425265 RepID=A8Q585_MALGO|nr:uncharacterized protein MGL_2750 [Malassezia globosa CBS 7966]EDP43154.1 hypothetical protein MGL_2750 [Malassezia globosa CBS 7966]
MLPHQQNKIDISSLTEEEQKLFRLYGKLPNRKDLVANKLKERKYFDSGDYALSKAGRAPKQSVGTTIPNPEMVPHAAYPSHPVQTPGMFVQGSGLGGATSGPNVPTSPGASNMMNVPSSPSGGHRTSVGSGSFTDTGSRSSFPMATGVMAGSPSREPTSSLSREQMPDPSSSNAMQE